MNDAPLLELNNVSRSFLVGGSLFHPRRLTAVDGVSLSVRRGDVLGIVGESGSGKTTLARIMLGLIPPTTGELRIAGHTRADLSRLEMARLVQLVFQDPSSALNPRQTIARIIAQPLRVHAVGDRAERARRVDDMLDVVGLPRRLRESYPNQLSGGQRQRVVIARALVLRPQLLVCDEPTSALDVSVQAQILNLLLDLRREFGLSYVIISHNLAVVEHMATEVAVMYLGRIVERTDAEALFRQPLHPYTRALLRATMTIAPRAGIPDTRLGGAVPDPTSLPTGCRFHPRCPEALPMCRDVAPPAIVTPTGAAECHLLAHQPAEGVAA